MDTIDQLVPLAEKDVTLLKSRQFIRLWEISVICFIAAPLVGFVGYQIFRDYYPILAVVGLICFIVLLIGGVLLKKYENEQVTRDLTEGLKRRIVAPVEEKETVDVTRRPHPLNIKKQIIKADQGVDLKYYMKIYGFRIPLSEDEYLSGARRGETVEFFVAPHSEIILSQPVRWPENKELKN